MTYTLGNLSLAYIMLLVPAFASSILWLGVFLRRASYRRRFHGWRLVWEMWLSSILLTVVFFGGVYWYLFWQPFYSITVQPNRAWSLQYVLPLRSMAVEPAQIQRISMEPDWLPIRSASARHVIRIQLQDGSSFTSAPLGRADAEQILQHLRLQSATVKGENSLGSGRSLDLMP